MAKRKKDIAKTLPYDARRDAQARDRLIQARVKMLLTQDFWGKLATRMRLVNADEWCPTLAVDGKNFYYNSAFVNSLKSIDKIVWGLRMRSCMWYMITSLALDRAIASSATSRRTM